MTPYVDDIDLSSSSSVSSSMLFTEGDSGSGDDSSSMSLIEYINYFILVFKNVSPYGFSAIGLACCIGPSVLGAAWYVSYGSFQTN